MSFHPSPLKSPEAPPAAAERALIPGGRCAGLRWTFRRDCGGGCGGSSPAWAAGVGAGAATALGESATVDAASAAADTAVITPLTTRRRMGLALCMGVFPDCSRTGVRHG